MQTAFRQCLRTAESGRVGALSLWLILGMGLVSNTLAQQTNPDAGSAPVQVLNGMTLPRSEQAATGEAAPGPQPPENQDNHAEQAVQAAISQALEDLKAKRKEEQQVRSANRAYSSSRNAPDWQRLQSKERMWLEPLAGVWHELPSADRWAWLQLARQFPKMPQAAQEQAQERMKQWSTYTPQQRQAARENFRLAQRLNESKLSAGQLQSLWERYRELTPEQRAVLRAAGQTSTTAARHAGAATPLAKEASRPLPALDRHGKPTP